MITDDYIDPLFVVLRGQELETDDERREVILSWGRLLARKVFPLTDDLESTLVSGGSGHNLIFLQQEAGALLDQLEEASGSNVMNSVSILMKLAGLTFRKSYRPLPHQHYQMWLAANLPERTTRDGHARLWLLNWLFGCLVKANLGYENPEWVTIARIKRKEIRNIERINRHCAFFLISEAVVQRRLIRILDIARRASKVAWLSPRAISDIYCYGQYGAGGAEDGHYCPPLETRSFRTGQFWIETNKAFEDVLPLTIWPPKAISRAKPGRPRSENVHRYDLIDWLGSIELELLVGDPAWMPLRAIVDDIKSELSIRAATLATRATKSKALVSINVARTRLAYCFAQIVSLAASKSQSRVIMATSEDLNRSKTSNSPPTMLQTKNDVTDHLTMHDLDRLELLYSRQVKFGDLVRSGHQRAAKKYLADLSSAGVPERTIQQILIHPNLKE